MRVHAARFAALVLLALAGTAPAVAGADVVVFEARVKASALNVRTEPNTNSAVRHTLRQGELLVVTPSRVRGWLVAGFDAGPNRPVGLGYVAAQHVEIIDIVPPDSRSAAPRRNAPGSGLHLPPALQAHPSRPACNGSNASISLELGRTDFECQRNFGGEGFRSCETTVPVALRSPCKSLMNVQVTCTAEFAFQTRNGSFTRTDSERKSTTILMNYGFGEERVRIDWRPLAFGDTVMRAQVTRLRCGTDFAF